MGILSNWRKKKDQEAARRASASSTGDGRTASSDAFIGNPAFFPAQSYDPPERPSHHGTSHDTNHSWSHDGGTSHHSGGYDHGSGSSSYDSGSSSGSDGGGGGGGGD